MESKELRNKMNQLSSGQSPWLKEAKWRQRNAWWLNIWARIQVKYYRYMRKFGLRK